MLEKLKADIKSKYIGAAVFLLVTAVLEVLAYAFGGVLSAIASRIWLTEGILLLCVFLFNAVKQVISDIKAKKFMVLICFAALLAIFISCIGNLAVSDINPDSCVQASAGLDSFALPDWGYTGKGFLGYPNRQYLIAAIPSVLFGRSVFCLHLGFAFPFLIGLASIYIELRKWVTEHFKCDELLALIPVGSFLVFPFITEYYRNFEQAFIPVAFTLIAASVFMRLVRKPDILTVLALAWTGSFLADSYTPGLASWALTVFFLVLYIFGYWKKASGITPEIKFKKSMLFLEISAVVNVITFFVATVVFGRGDRITTIGEDASIKNVLISSVDAFIHERNVRFLGFFAGAFVIYLLFSFLGQLKIYDVILSGWMLGVVFISSYLKGVTTYGKEHLAQRFMIIVPVFIIAGFIVVMRLIQKHNIRMRKRTVAILFVFTLICGFYNLCQVNYSFRYIGNIVSIRYLIPEIRKTIEKEGLSINDSFNVVVYTDNGLQTNMGDYAKYFYPNAECITYGTADLANDPEIENENPVILASEACFPNDAVKDGDNEYWFKDKNYIFDRDVTWYLLYRQHT